jgi:hypothetical protein
MKRAPIDETVSRNSVVAVCVKIHKSVEAESATFLSETKRFTACTPSKYFELLSLFSARLMIQQSRVATSVQKYSNGVDKINSTRERIAVLSDRLDRDIPVLEKKRAEGGRIAEEFTVEAGRGGRNSRRDL